MRRGSSIMNMLNGDAEKSMFTMTNMFETLFKAIEEFQWRELQLAKLLAPYLTHPLQCAFWLLGVDVTPQPRPFAQTLSDRLDAQPITPRPVACALAGRRRPAPRPAPE